MMRELAIAAVGSVIGVGVISLCTYRWGIAGLAVAFGVLFGAALSAGLLINVLNGVPDRRSSSTGSRPAAQQSRDER
jgi:hypothetical protein